MSVLPSTGMIHQVMETFHFLKSNVRQSGLRRAIQPCLTHCISHPKKKLAFFRAILHGNRFCLTYMAPSMHCMYTVVCPYTTDIGRRASYSVHSSVVRRTYTVEANDIIFFPPKLCLRTLSLLTSHRLSPFCSSSVFLTVHI
jgi:hypothetical protein